MPDKNIIDLEETPTLAKVRQKHHFKEGEIDIARNAFRIAQLEARVARLEKPKPV